VTQLAQVMTGKKFR